MVNRKDLQKLKNKNAFIQLPHSRCYETIVATAASRNAMYVRSQEATTVRLNTSAEAQAEYLLSRAVRSLDKLNAAGPQHNSGKPPGHERMRARSTGLCRAMR